MATTATQSTPRAGTYEEIDGVLYPCVEETPVVQSDWHDDAVFEVKGMLRAHFADEPRVYIGSDMFLYYARGMPWKHQAPDIFVCPDVEPRGQERKSFYVWRERSGPHFILEVLSDSTAEDDRGRKLRAYRDDARAAEYFILDPRLRPMRLWGYRLRGTEYDIIERNGDGRVWSERLGLWFGVDEVGYVRLWTAAGKPLLRHREILRRAEAEARRAAEQAHRAAAEAGRAEAEARRAEAAEARVRELEEALCRHHNR